MLIFARSHLTFTSHIVVIPLDRLSGQQSSEMPLHALSKLMALSMSRDSKHALSALFSLAQQHSHYHSHTASVPPLCCMATCH